MSTLQEDVIELRVLKNKLKQFIHGGLTVDISTDSGLWPSIPKAIHEATASATLEIADLKDQAETAASQSAQHSSNSATSAEAAQQALAKIKGQSASATTLAAGESATAEYNPTTGNIAFGIPLGDKGEKGDRGLKGAKGDKGLDSTVPGPQGEQGIKGDRGEKGETGDKGLDSTIAGPQGEQGIKGDRGEKGEKGDKGLNSTVAGPQGEQGIKGDRGDKGEKGDTFSVDAIGTRAQRDAYNAEAKGYSFFSTDEKLLYFRLAVPGWSDGVPFGQGEKGDRGEQGIQGVAGTAGADSTVPGPKGDKGDAGSDASVTKGAVESVLTGEIASHTHAIESVTGLPEALNSKLSSLGVADNLTTTDADQVLSANQGSVLKGLIDNMAAVIASDDVSLDKLTEIVAYIKANRSTIDSLGITGVAGLRSELDTIIASVASVQSALALKADKSELQNSSSTFTTPAPLTVLAGATAVSSLPELSASAYRNAFSEPRVARRFQIDLAADDFSSPVYEFAGDVDSHTVAVYLATETEFKWRCRDETAVENSKWLEAQSFTTDAAFINDITLSVQGAPNSVIEKPILTAGGFSVHNGTDTHVSTDWLVKKDGVVIYSSINNSANKTSFQVPKGVLDANTIYEFSARMKGASLGYSGYKAVTVTTIPAFDFAPAFMVSKNGALGGLVFGQDIDTLTPLNPIPLPVSGGSRSDTEFVNDGDFLFCKESGLMTIYKRNIRAYIKNPVAFPSPASNVRVFAFGEENGAAIVVAGGNTPNQLGVYNVPASNASIQKFTTPAPTSLYVQKIVCNVNARHIVVISANASNTTYISVYYRNGGTVTKVQNWGYGATNSRAVAISPSGHRMILFVANSLYFYGKNANHTYSQVATPANWITRPYGMSFSPDGRFFAAYDAGSAGLTIYSISGNTFTRVYYGTEAFFVNSKWSQDGEYLMITNTTDGLILYKRSGNSFVKLPSTAAMKAEKGTKLSWIGEQ